jgi:hypothetical protein
LLRRGLADAGQVPGVAWSGRLAAAWPAETDAGEEFWRFRPSIARLVIFSLSGRGTTVLKSQ